MLGVMKVSIVRGGGFGGLVTVTTADTASLAPEDAERLRAEVEQTGLFDLPEHMSGPPQQPHPFSYAVTVEDQDRTHTVRVSEEDLPESLSSLVSWVSSVEGREERVVPPGIEP
jgi:Emfourin